MKPTNPLRLALLIAAAACATSAPKTPAPPPAPAGPPPLPAVALKPADQVRPSLAFLVTAASPLRLVADLDALSSSLKLPMSLGQAALERLMKMPLGAVSLTRAQLDRIDPGRSVAFAILAGKGDLACAALPFKDAALAQRTLEELGPEAERAEGATARKLPSGGVLWAGLSGTTLLTASSKEALLSAGALAVEGERAPRDGQAMLTIYPQNLARAQGVPLATLVEMAAAAMSAKLEEAAKQPPAAPGRGKKAPPKKDPDLTPAMSRLLIAAFKTAAQPIAESETVRVVLKLGTTDGIRLRTEIVPLAGSASAARTQARPYGLDGKLGVADDRTSVLAFGEAGTGIAALVGAIAATGPAGKAFSQKVGVMVNEIAGGAFCTMRSLAPLDSLCAFQLRPGVTPARALDSYADVFKYSQAWNDEVMGKKKTRVTVKRSKDAIDVEVKMAGIDPRSQALQKAMWGGGAQRNTVVVRDGRLLQAQGANPREILARPDQPAKPGAAPIFEGVARQTKGAEALFFVDLMSIMGAGVKAAEDPSVKQVEAMLNAVPGLAELRAPLVVALWGGKTTALDVQLPYQSLVNVVQVMRPFMGMMGGPPPSRP